MNALVLDPKEPNVNLRVPNPSRTRCLLAGLSANSVAGVTTRKRPGFSINPVFLPLSCIFVMVQRWKKRRFLKKFLS